MTIVVISCASGVGATSVAHRFLKGAFEDLHPSQGPRWAGSKLTAIEGREYRVHIRDIPGQIWQSSNNDHVRHADGILFVYDVSDTASLEALKRLNEDIAQNAPKNAIRMVIGNKKDLFPNDKAPSVNSVRAKDLAASLGMIFFGETSAKDGTNVDTAFTTLATLVRQRLSPEEIARRASEEAKHRAASEDEARRLAREDEGSSRGRRGGPCAVS